MNNMLGKDVVHIAIIKYNIPSLSYVENNMHVQCLIDMFCDQHLFTSFMNVEFIKVYLLKWGLI